MKHDKPGKSREIHVEDIESPALVQASHAKWQTVTIPLTADQISQLKELGVDTKAIRIRTFDIKRLATVVPN